MIPPSRLLHRRFGCWPVLSLCLLLLACAFQPAQPPLAFDTAGGEAWSFEKTIGVTATAGACDTVAFTSPLETEFAPPAADDRFVATLRLQAGENRIAAACHKDGAARGPMAEQHWFVRLPDTPKAWAQLQLAHGRLVVDASGSEPAPAESAALTSFEWRARRGNPAPIPELPAYGRQIALTPPAADGEYQVILRVTDTLGRSDESTALFRVRNGKPEIVDPAREHAAWIDRAIIYGVAPFFYGPRGFADVIARLDDIAALGVDTLLLSPVTQSAEDDFGYAITDHFRLRSSFGTEAEWRELIAASHARGLRVLIDFVPNHLSDQHPYFTDAARQHGASPYYSFFDRAPHGEATHYFNWLHLKNLNYSHPEVQRMMIEAAVYWVRAFDVDGFRVDAAWGPRQRAPEFWPRWSRELKRIKPDLLLLAEASARDPYYFTHGFDAAYDWTEQLGRWAWRPAFEDEANTAHLLRDAITASRYLPDALIFRFINNNDTGRRFIDRYGLPRTRVAAAMLLTLPGLPNLYSGDEVGAVFLPYDEEPIRWEDPHRLRPWYSKLITLRRQQAALRSSDVEFLEIGSPEQVLAYLRPGRTPRDSILVLLNYGAATQDITLSPRVAQAMLPQRGLVDLLNEENIPGGTISLPGHSARILQAR